jgi:hypothetical protein
MLCKVYHEKDKHTARGKQNMSRRTYETKLEPIERPWWARVGGRERSFKKVLFEND